MYVQSQKYLLSIQVMQTHVPSKTSQRGLPPMQWPQESSYHKLCGGESVSLLL